MFFGFHSSQESGWHWEVQSLPGSAQFWLSQAPNLQHCPSSPREGPATTPQFWLVLRAAPKLLFRGGRSCTAPAAKATRDSAMDLQCLGCNWRSATQTPSGPKGIHSNSRDILYFLVQKSAFADCSSACLAADTPLCASPKSPLHTSSYFSPQPTLERHNLNFLTEYTQITS